MSGGENVFIGVFSINSMKKKIEKGWFGLEKYSFLDNIIGFVIWGVGLFVILAVIVIIMMLY